MKSKLILVGGTILATAFVVFAVAWNQYPIVLRPQPADTFLIGTTTTNQQIASSNVLAWTETNAVRRIAGSNYLFSSTAAITYEPVNSARNATNGYPWGSLYDVAGAAQNATNRLVSTNDLRAVNLPNGSNVFKASVVSSETFNLVTPPISGGATGAVWQSTVNGTAVLQSGSFTLDFQLGNNGLYEASGWPNEFTWRGAFDGNGALVTNQTFAFQFVVDGGGSAVTTGTKTPVRLPRGGTITGASLYADQNGSCGVDLWKTNYATFVSSAVTTVTGFSYPALSNTNHVFDTTLTGWIKSFSAGDVFTMNVVSNAACTRVTLQITYSSL